MMAISAAIFFPVTVCQKRNIKWKVFELDSEFLSSCGKFGVSYNLSYLQMKKGYIPKSILKNHQNSDGIIFLVERYALKEAACVNKTMN